MRNDSFEDRIDLLIASAKEQWKFFKERGSKGAIEAAAMQIRIRALEDAKAEYMQSSDRPKK